MIGSRKNRLQLRVPVSGSKSVSRTTFRRTRLPRCRENLGKALRQLAFIGYNICSPSLSSQFVIPPLPTAVFALTFAPKGVLPYIRQHFLDRTFQGLYQVNGFAPRVALIPYSSSFSLSWASYRSTHGTGPVHLYQQAQEEQDHSTSGLTSMKCRE